MTIQKKKKGRKATEYLKANLKSLGVSSACFCDLILPAWWADDCEDDAGALQGLMIRVMRFLDCSAEQARQSMRGIVTGLELSESPAVNLKRINKKSAGRNVRATIRMCEELAARLTRAFSEDEDLAAAEAEAKPEMSVRERALRVRAEILAQSAYVDLLRLLEYCEAKGIIVAHFCGVPGGKIDGAALEDEEHPVIILGSKRTANWIPFHLAHELGHILLRHGESYFCELNGEAEDDKQEQEANEFAEYLLLGEKGRQQLPQLMGRGMRDDRACFVSEGRARRVAPEVLALFAAHEQNRKLYGYVKKMFTADSSNVHEDINLRLRARIEDLGLGASAREEIFRYLDYSGK